MGFGLIFAGYITLLFFKVMPPAMAVGAYLMYRGLVKLRDYGKNFLYASYAAAGLIGYYLVYCSVWIFRMAGFGEEIVTSTAFMLCDDVVYYAVLLVFHVFLYAGLLDISKQCGYDKGIKKAYMSRVLTAMFYVLTAVNIPLYYLGIVTYLPLACFLCQAVWIIYTAVYIYGCYMRIATDEIIAEEEKKIAQYDAKYAYRHKRK